MIFCFVLKIVKEDLSVLRVNLLAENQECSSVIIILAVSISSSIELQWKNTFVSSAKILKSPSLHELAISSMYIMKSKGPSTDPCETQQVTGLMGEDALFTFTNCCLLVR